MSSSKALAEAALSCLNRLKEFPMHEKFAVLGLMNGMLSSEAKTEELDSLVQRVRAEIVRQHPEDEHYQQ
jgi:hypothetical protein